MMEMYTTYQPIAYDLGLSVSKTALFGSLRPLPISKTKHWKYQKHIFDAYFSLPAVKVSEFTVLEGTC